MMKRLFASKTEFIEDKWENQKIVGRWEIY